MTAPPPACESSDDELLYDLGDWSPEQRAGLDRLLAGNGLSYRWEPREEARGPAPADQLVVHEVDADLVEQLIDEVDHPDALEADDTGADDRGGEILSDLYLAGDVLLGAPGNAAAAERARDAAAAAAASVSPYGLDDGAWEGVRRRAGLLVEELGVGDDERVAAAARALRDAVRPLV